MKILTGRTRLVFLLLGVMAIFPASMARASTLTAGSPVEGKTPSRLEITFEYRRQSGIASNQFAVWIEDASGAHIKTLYATRFTAAGGWKRRPACLPEWVAAARPDDLSSREFDAITGATPAGGRLDYAWDGNGRDGGRVPPGTYRFVLEANLRWDSRVVYRGEVEFGGPAQTLRPEPEFFGDADRERGMITNVAATYRPFGI